MNIIYILSALAIGFLFGTIVETFIDSRQINQLADQNNKLRLENEQLREEAKHEVIEIVDNRTKNGEDQNRAKNGEVKFGGF